MDRRPLLIRLDRFRRTARWRSLRHLGFALVALGLVACDSPERTESNPPAPTEQPGATVGSIPGPSPAGAEDEPDPSALPVPPPMPELETAEDPCAHPEDQLPTAGQLVRGPADAAVTVYVVLEPRSVASAQLHNDWLPGLLDESGDAIRLVERVVASHDDDEGLRAVRAFGVAQRRDVLGRYADGFFAEAARTGDDGSHLRLASLTQIASAAGIGGIAFRDALESEASAAAVTSMERFLETSGRVEVPAIYLNGVEWDGELTLDALTEAIAERAEACTSSAGE